MNSNLQVDDSTYVVDNKRFLREVIVMKATRDLCVIKYIDTGSLIRVRNSRLFPSKRKAELSMPQSAHPDINHWKYEKING